MRSFGEILRSQRQKLGLTQKQVAGSVGVSDAYICSLESGKKCPPPYRTVAVMADVLEIDLERLWKVAVKHREKQALEKSRLRNMMRRGDAEEEDCPSHQKAASETEINVFFTRPEIQMATFGFFQKQSRDMSMEEKRAVYEAVIKVQNFMSSHADEPTDST